VGITPNSQNNQGIGGHTNRKSTPVDPVAINLRRVTGQAVIQQTEKPIKSEKSECSIVGTITQKEKNNTPRGTLLDIFLLT